MPLSKVVMRECQVIGLWQFHTYRFQTNFTFNFSVTCVSLSGSVRSLNREVDLTSTCISQFEGCLFEKLPEDYDDYTSMPGMPTMGVNSKNTLC